MRVARVVADGQLASSSATLLGTDRYERVLKISLFNTSDSLTLDVWLTLTRADSSARIVARSEIGPYETLTINGLGMDPTDVLAGYAEAASLVDYLIWQDWDRGVALSTKFDYQRRNKAGVLIGGEPWP